ncbi:hypothetical protein AABB24_035718 [Solanum stoloniferum]|uniref:Secreted protein n=1 Tax=Solanum stoloniferum TaxID=62892 RepID=A0ABD2RA22_9SOLN
MLNFSCAFFFSGLTFSVFRRLFPCLHIVSNLLLLQRLMFGEVLANEFHISLLLYAMALCALKFCFRNSSFEPRVYRKPSLNPHKGRDKEASCKDHVSRRCKLTVLSY